MKRLLLAIGTVVALAAVIPLAATGSYDPQIIGAGARATDSYVGTNHFAVQVRQGVNGVSGVFTLHPDADPSATFRVDVKCDYIAGNVGMLGCDYGGYFEAGDADALATLIERCRDEPAILQELGRQCAAREPLFEPTRERATLLALLDDLLETPR
jgi:hypothetical protein